MENQLLNYQQISEEFFKIEAEEFMDEIGTSHPELNSIFKFMMEKNYSIENMINSMKKLTNILEEIKTNKPKTIAILPINIPCLLRDSIEDPSSKSNDLVYIIKKGTILNLKNKKLLINENIIIDIIVLDEQNKQYFFDPHWDNGTQYKNGGFIQEKIINEQLVLYLIPEKGNIREYIDGEDGLKETIMELFANNIIQK